MWAKLSNALKSTEQLVEQPPSPPGSPSKPHGKRAIFKRLSRRVEEMQPIGFPKKVRSQLNLTGNGMCYMYEYTSLADYLSSGSTQSLAQPRPSTDSRRYDSLWSSGNSMSMRVTDKQALLDGSVRSILKDPKTPGTGQNVRFNSKQDTEFNPNLEDEQPRPSDTPTLSHRPTIQDIFGPGPSDSPALQHIDSMMMPMSPPNTGNIFNISLDRELPQIPVEAQTPMDDNAVEVTDTETSEDELADGTQFYSLEQTMKRSAYDLDARAPSPVDSGHATASQRSSGSSFANRERILSLRGMIQEAEIDANKGRGSNPPSSARSSGSSFKRHSGSSSTKRDRLLSLQNMLNQAERAAGVEGDINDTSSGDVILYRRPSPDPFSADSNGRTYYQDHTSPPRSTHSSATNHSRQASKDESMLFALRTQLALQQDLCAQYEVDLAARDALVSALNHKLTSTEAEVKKRRDTGRGWRKKVMELERVCMHLEEEVDRSRNESSDRSLMDEASSAAMRVMQQKIVAGEEERLALAEKADRLQAMLDKRDVQERELREGIEKAGKEMEEMGNVSTGGDDALRELLVVQERANEEERERHIEQEEKLFETCTQLGERVGQAETRAKEAEDKLKVVQDELEAQWKNTELAGERYETLSRDQIKLSRELEGKERRIMEMEQEWADCENRRVELEAERERVSEALLLSSLMLMLSLAGRRMLPKTTPD